MKQELVSIIMPSYNSVYICESIESVLTQSYECWELLITDDCSTDYTRNIVAQYAAKDPRIKLFKLDQNSGAGVARNNSIEQAQGRFIAFLDSDDIWLPDKLITQVPLFQKDDVAIVFSYYEKMGVYGNLSDRVIKSPSRVDYKELLNGNCIGCLTAIYDTAKVGKVFFKSIGHEDFLLWLTILHKGYLAVNTDNVCALYRVNNSSLSSNKLQAMKWHWDILRKELKLNIIQSIYYFINYAVRAVLKRAK